MRAVVYDEYGGADRLRLVELPAPEPAPDQVLIAVMATSIELSDWETLQGRPLYARAGGLRRPKRPVLGSDIAGRIETIGSDVTGVEPGDEVYGDNLELKGGFAQLAVAPVSALAHKPPELSFAKASVIPQSGAIALQGVEESGPDLRVLINGGGGGSGCLAIQLARLTGAHVTAVDNAAKLDFMTALGAAQSLDRSQGPTATPGS